MPECHFHTKVSALLFNNFVVILYLTWNPLKPTNIANVVLNRHSSRSIIKKGEIKNNDYLFYVYLAIFV